MDTSETTLADLTAQSFIIKFWLEESHEAGEMRIWRGQITHVPSGERGYLLSLGDLIPFMSPHLQKMGIEIGDRRR